MELGYKSDKKITINTIYSSRFGASNYQYFSDNFCETNVESISLLEKDVEIWKLDCTVPEQLKCKYTFCVCSFCDTFIDIC